MKNTALDLALQQSRATSTEGGFTEVVEAEIAASERREMRMNSCWKRLVLMEVH